MSLLDRLLAPARLAPVDVRQVLVNARLVALHVSGQTKSFLSSLEKAELIRRVERRNSAGAKLSNRYDLDGLVKRLKELEPEFRRAEEKAKAERQAVSRRGRRLRTGTEMPGPKN